MSNPLPILIQTLRDELQQYGEMLALLDQQQEFVVSRAADEMLQTSSAIQAQTVTVHAARDRREECRRELAVTLGLQADAPFAKIIPELPLDYRPLVSALVDENNTLLVRIQQRARQNHLLLSRSVALMQRFMESLMPALRSTVYNGNGGLIPGATPLRPLYEGVG